MDRTQTQLVVILAAITAQTHTEKPKESSQESQNDISAKPPIAETTTQPLEVLCDCNQGSQTDISANGPSMISRNKENRTILEARLIKSRFYVHCSCDSHTKEFYFNWPYSCSAKHHEDDIVLQPNSRPTLLHEYEDGAYENLSLANRTIEYFSRPESTMDSDKLLPLLNGEEAASAPAFSKC
ncbi:hypothetical protein J4E91_009237 [Alternaria rosae]|nr:hypothetical protein J4E91_009237 [Alternaria rosae]